MSKRPNKISDLAWLDYQGRLNAILATMILGYVASWTVAAAVWAGWLVVTVVMATLKAREAAE